MPRVSDRVICSTISFRHQSLGLALETIAGLGFTGVDVGALPGVCDHVPQRLDREGVRHVAETVRASGLRVRSVNGDVGDLNEVVDRVTATRRSDNLERLLDLCSAVGASALVLPNGRQEHAPVRDLDTDLDVVAARLAEASDRARARELEIWVEAPHLLRLAHDMRRSAALYERLPAEVGAVCDVSHVVASGSTPRAFLEAFAERTRHVHLRDAEPGYIHHSIGRGRVDFVDTVDALRDVGYAGALALELETRDVTDEERPAAAKAAAEYITDLLSTPTTEEDSP